MTNTASGASTTTNTARSYFQEGPGSFGPCFGDVVTYSANTLETAVTVTLPS